MKKIALFLSLSTLVIISGGCIKDTKPCQQKTIASEDAAMLSMAATFGMTPTQHSSGMYYQIVNPGTGVNPTTSSTVTVKYTGKFADGNTFDQNTTGYTNVLNQLILGWQIGLPLIKKGGVIRLIIPSSYGYGCSANGPIPAYSILYFEIELVNVS